MATTTSACSLPTLRSALIRNLVTAVLVSTGNALSTATVAPAAKATAASGVSQFVPASFAGIGIEPSDLFYFTGGAETNDFSIQLMQNLATYSGKPMSVRVGGNSQDYAVYQANMDDFLVQRNSKAVGQGDVAPTDYYIIGPRYFEAMDRFPAGTPITFGLNMAYYEADYLDQITIMAQAAVTQLDNVNLTSFEIGNEPNIYLSNGFRNTTDGNWTGAAYVEEWLNRADAIYSRVLQPYSLPMKFFEGPCSASLIMETFGIEQLVKDGLQTDVVVEKDNEIVANSTYLNSWNQHDYLYFIGQSNFSLSLEWLMGLNNTEWQFGHWADQVGVARATGLTYHLREMGSVGPVGQDGVSDSFGAALWTLNFFLYGAAISMSGINIHMTESSYAGPWKPRALDGEPQVVRPAYYAYAAMAQLVGSGNGTTQIAKLSSDGMPAAYDDYVRMYAGYGEGRLTSVVIINALQANASSTNKGSLNVSLSLDGYEGQTVFLSYLTAPGADSLDETVWNGLQFSDTNGTSSFDEAAIHNVTIGDDGKAVVSVRDSQAVVAYIGSRLGSNEVLLTSMIPDDSDGDGDGDGNSTTTGAGSSSSDDSNKSAAAVSRGYTHTFTVLLLTLWSGVAWHIL